MASALLASRNEPCWGESKVYMRKYSNSSKPHPNFNPNPNPNPNPRIHDSGSKSHGRFTDETPMAGPASTSDDSKESSRGGYVTFNLAAYSNIELRELKKRLLLELEQVRELRNRIDSNEIQQSRSGYYAGPHSAVTRPPPIQIGGGAVESPGSSSLRDKKTPKANQHYASFENAARKDKLVHPDNKLYGSKRSIPVGSGPDPKRQATGPLMQKAVSSMMKKCAQMLTKLMKHKHGWIFNIPVDAVGLGLHDYHQIVKEPMDLGTVKSKLEKNLYESPSDFASDVRLTFNNALLYNPKGHDVYIVAAQMLSRFDEVFNPAFKKFESEQRKMLAAEEARKRAWAPPPPAAPVMQESTNRSEPTEAPARKSVGSMRVQGTSPVDAPAPIQSSASLPLPKSAPTPAPSHPPSSAKPWPTMRPVIGKLPKPKARDLNKRDMSFDEKAKLGLHLQNLPQEKMEQLVQIIRKRNSHMAQEGDEIELDIEAIDTETLWELDRFVSNYNKLASKIKRQGLMNNQITYSEINKSPSRNEAEAEAEAEAPSEAASMATAAARSSKKGEGGDEDVDIGDEAPMTNFPPVEIEKENSSSSSSSSSDSSSSSGSDSVSSSGSDSEAESVGSKEKPPL